ncbi:putative flavin-containing monoamine oxidase A isoform X2 [Apostichopus japonicus]|uniref:monoamine oxidase n=1 Tax=Stichopus japonicus TaxID=307972 RepID=A0A2G8JY05_STIJA|nr:putative flavin-containing monoamine oxidase A isoform X2 [Apostichopus japonicus]
MAKQVRYRAGDVTGERKNSRKVELGLETYEQDYAGFKMLIPAEGAPVSFEGYNYPIGMIGRYDLNSFIARLEILRDLVPLEDPTKCEDALEWDATTLEQFKRSHTWTDGGRQIFDALVVLSLGVTPREISLLFFLYLLNTYGGWNNMCNIGKGSGKELKIKGGAERLCAILADRIGRENIIFSDPVTELHQDDDERCQVRSRGGRVFWARRVVMTVPPKCIDQMDFRPKLPLGKDTIINTHFPENA